EIPEALLERWVATRRKDPKSTALPLDQVVEMAGTLRLPQLSCLSAFVSRDEPKVEFNLEAEALRKDGDLLRVLARLSPAEKERAFGQGVQLASLAPPSRAEMAGLLKDWTPWLLDADGGASVSVRLYPEAQGEEWLLTWEVASRVAAPPCGSAPPFPSPRATPRPRTSSTAFSNHRRPVRIVRSTSEARPAQSGTRGAGGTSLPSRGSGRPLPLFLLTHEPSPVPRRSPARFSGVRLVVAVGFNLRRGGGTRAGCAPPNHHPWPRNHQSPQGDFPPLLPRFQPPAPSEPSPLKKLQTKPPAQALPYQGETP
ncbi:MAG TPA: hypothetical protein VFU47_16670, partial [Armatimonadota bacterium]|nr:hypothetical protein [Armatimonadota bacterium]